MLDDIETEKETEDVIEPTEDEDIGGDDDLEDVDFSMVIDEDDLTDDEDSDKSGDDDDKPDYKAEIDGLKAEIGKANKRADGAAYAARKAQEAASKTKKDEEEEELTPSQIDAIIEEHKDDPSVLRRTFEYIAEQKAKGVTRDQLDTQKVEQKQTELSAYMDKSFPEYNQEGSEINTAIKGVKEALNLKNHPYADFLATSALLHGDMQKIQDAAYKKGQQDALNKEADATRKKTIDNSKPTPRGKKNKGADGDIPDYFKKTADQLGLSPSQRKIAAKLIKNKSNVVEV